MPPAIPEKCEAENRDFPFCLLRFLPVFLGGFPCAIENLLFCACGILTEL